MDFELIRIYNLYFSGELKLGLFMGFSRDVELGLSPRISVGAVVLRNFPPCFVLSVFFYR